MSKREISLLAIACTFIGIVLGFFLAPMKAGLTIASNNTITETKNPDSIR
jgi:hypothetical protein